MELANALSSFICLLWSIDTLVAWGPTWDGRSASSMDLRQAAMLMISKTGNFSMLVGNVVLTEAQVSTSLEHVVGYAKLES